MQRSFAHVRPALLPLVGGDGGLCGVPLPLLGAVGGQREAGQVLGHQLLLLSLRHSPLCVWLIVNFFINLISPSSLLTFDET